MSDPASGQPRDRAPRIARCSCGQLQAEVFGAPFRVSVCHCLECKRRSGSAFAWAGRYYASQVTLSGTRRTFVRVGDEGSRITFRFCPDCGVTVAYENDDLPGMIALPAGTFADPGYPAPTVSVYDPARICAWLDLVTEPPERWG